MPRDIVLGISIHSDPEPIYRAISTQQGLATFWVPSAKADA